MNGDRNVEIWNNTKSYPYTYNDRLTRYVPFNSEDLKYIIIDKNDSYVDKQECAKKIDLTFSYSDDDEKTFEITPINQIEKIIEKLKESPYSRRSQAITWRPGSDLERDDPPCLQRIWVRIFEGKMRFNTHWRSRDLFGAWEGNVNGMFQIANYIAKRLGVVFNEYYDFCDSLHIYGRQKLVFAEVVPLLERIKEREGLERKSYEEKLEYWVKLRKAWEKRREHENKEQKV